MLITLSDDALKWHPRLGIHAANVAPEFGVTETLALLNILEENSQQKLVDEFLSISFNSDSWKKWMLNDSKADDRQKAIIGGHYVFSTNEFKKIKKQAIFNLHQKGINLDSYLEDCIKKKHLKVFENFRLVK